MVSCGIVSLFTRVLNRGLRPPGLTLWKRISWPCSVMSWPLPASASVASFMSRPIQWKWVHSLPHYCWLLYGGFREENIESSSTQALLQVSLYEWHVCELSPQTREGGKVCGPPEFCPYQSTKFTIDIPWQYFLAIHTSPEQHRVASTFTPNCWPVLKTCHKVYQGHKPLPCQLAHHLLCLFATPNAHTLPSTQLLFFDWLTLKVKALWCFDVLGLNYPTI